MLIQLFKSRLLLLWCLMIALLWLLAQHSMSLPLVWTCPPEVWRNYLMQCSDMLYNVHMFNGVNNKKWLMSLVHLKAIQFWDSPGVSTVLLTKVSTRTVVIQNINTYMNIMDNANNRSYSKFETSISQNLKVIRTISAVPANS